jgi:hypothetical protein
MAFMTHFWDKMSKLIQLLLSIAERGLDFADYKRIVEAGGGGGTTNSCLL